MPGYRVRRSNPSSRTARDLPIPAGIELMNGRDQMNALRSVLDSVGVRGEVNFIRRIPKEHRLVILVVIPGREVVVDLNTETRSAQSPPAATACGEGWSTCTKCRALHNANCGLLKGPRAA
jgi:hypothetical protein